MISDPKHQIPSTNPLDDVLEQLQAHALIVVQRYPEAKWLPMMRNQAAHLQIEFDVKDPDLIVLLNQATIENDRPEKLSQIVRAGQPVLTPTQVPVLPGFINKSRLHLLNAEQGAGKSTFCLGLFRALLSEQQTQQYLDLDVLTSKNWQLFLIGPDMSRDAWKEPLLNYGLASVIKETPEGSIWEPVPGVVLYPQETGMSLSPEDIVKYREMALTAKAEGKTALFVFDAYNTLLSNFMGSVDERVQAFAKPMRDLSKGMANTGATTIVLHHVPRSASSSVASSGGGHNSLGSIPDVVIEMSAMGRNSDRLFLTSAKRIDKTCLMVEQHYKEGRWESHGDAKDAATRRDLLEKIDSLRHPKNKIYELAEIRWEDQKLPFSTKHVEKWCEASAQSARLHVRVMEAKGIFWRCDDEKTAGANLALYIPFEFKQEFLAAKYQNRSNPYERVRNPTLGAENTGKSTALEACEMKNGYESASVRQVDDVDPVELAESVAPEAYETLSNLRSLNNLTNAYGENVPSVHQMVEDINGKNSMVITELVPGTAQVKVQQFGNASAPIKTRRWMLDAFPCGWNAKHNPVVFDENEEL